MHSFLGVPVLVRGPVFGNLYMTETYEGRRLQKFVYKGIGPVSKLDQGTVWPAK